MVGYTYKKETSRFIISDNPALKYMQAIYGCRILEFLSKNDLIVNIDESMYTRSINQSYSLLPKGRSELIINQQCKGLATVIFAL